MRNCEDCGKTVGIGSGRWTGDQTRPETLKLHHTDPSECGKKKRTLSLEHIAKLQAGRKK